MVSSVSARPSGLKYDLKSCTSCNSTPVSLAGGPFLLTRCPSELVHSVQRAHLRQKAKGEHGVRVGSGERHEVETALPQNNVRLVGHADDGHEVSILVFEHGSAEGVLQVPAYVVSVSPMDHYVAPQVEHENGRYARAHHLAVKRAKILTLYPASGFSCVVRAGLPPGRPQNTGRSVHLGLSVCSSLRPEVERPALRAQNSPANRHQTKM
eukprot:scaffold4404_cov383-Prasinococcus_capsulatus_cf.AAC.4